MKIKRPLSQIIDESEQRRKKKPTQKEIDGLFDVLSEEGLVEKKKTSNKEVVKIFPSQTNAPSF